LPDLLVAVAVAVAASDVAVATVFSHELGRHERAEFVCGSNDFAVKFAK
jgi:hypothetical protein